MFRRDCTLFLRCVLLSLAILCAAAGIGAGAAALLVREGNLYTPVKIAVVDREDSITSRVLVRTVRNLDAFAAVLDAEVMKEEDADRAFRSGEAAAVVILPERFVTDILSGTEAGGVIRLSPALARQSDIVEAAARFGETLLAAGQYGVFSGEVLLDEEGSPSSVRNDYLDRVNRILLDEGMNVSDTYLRVEEADFGGAGLDAVGHYVLCWAALVLFLTALAFIPLYRTDASPSLLRRMAVSGVGPVRFLGWKLILPFLFRFALTLGLLGALSAAGLIPAFGGEAVLAALLLSLWMAAVGACLALCFGGGVAAVCALAGSGLILCGGVIPRPVLPSWLLTVGDLTPYGAARGLLLPAFSAESGWGGALAAAVYLAAAVLLLRLRWDALIRGEEAGQ